MKGNAVHGNRFLRFFLKSKSDIMMSSRCLGTTVLTHFSYTDNFI